VTISLSTPITGAAQTGFTTPTYTLTTDTPPNVNGKQWAVSAIGGTQTGVDINTVSKPFTISFFRPPVLKVLPAANPTTGVIKNVPVNTYKMIVRKGALPAANQTAQVCRTTVQIDVPAGTDTYEPEDVRAMLSAAIGALSQISAGIGDTCVTGVLG